MIETLIFNFLFDSIKKGINSIFQTHPIRKTIDKLNERYEEIENLSVTLEAWLQNNGIIEQINLFIKGKSKINITELATALVKDGKFYFGEETENKSIKIIEYFFSILNEEYLKSESGIVFHDYKEEERHQETLTEIKKTNESIKYYEKIDTRLANIAAAIPSVDKLTDKIESQYFKRIDEAKEFLLEGKVKIAKKLYKTLINDLSKEKDFPKKLEFRVFTNLGCCEVELCDYDSAVSYFEKAHELLPEDPIGLVNIAVANQLKGNITEGLQYVNSLLSKYPKDKLGICVKADLLSNLSKFDEALELFKTSTKEGFDKELLQDDKCNFTIGHIFYKKNNYLNTQKYLKPAVLKNTTNPDYFFVLGMSYCYPLLKRREFPWLLSKKSKQKLKEGEKNLTKAINILKDQEKEKKFELVLINRSAVRLALNDCEGSIQDCKKILSNDPFNFQAVKNKAIAEGFGGKFDQAIESLKNLLKDKKNHKEVIPMIVYAFLCKVPPEPKKAIEIINKYYPGKKISKHNLDFRIDLAECFISANELQEADTLIEELRKYSPQNKRLLYLLFKYYRKKNDCENAEKYAFEALERIKGLEKKIVILEIANFYYQNKFYDKAIPLYEKIINIEFNNSILRSYLVCLYYSKDKKTNHLKLLKICKDFREKFGITKFISEIEAALLENTDNLSVASDLYFNLSKIEPDNINHKKRYSIVEYRLGNEQLALKTINQIKDFIEGDAEDLIILAEILNSLDENISAIQLAYKALNLAPHDPQINIAYVHIFLARESADDQNLFNPKSIEVNTTVELRINGNKKSVRIVDSIQSQKTSDDISIESDIGKKLLNCKVGDKISLGESEDTKQLIEILEIKSIYVKAFQENIQNFNFLFPGEKGIQAIKVDKELKSILKLADEKSKVTSQFIQLYMEKKFPIGFLSNVLGITLFDTWVGLINSDASKLICSSGNIQSINKEVQIAETADEIIIDIIGLFTVAHLNIFNLLHELFNTIFISQSCLDEINYIHTIHSMAKEKGYLTVGKYKDHYFTREISPEEIEYNINHIKKIKEKILSKCKTVGFITPIDDSDLMIAKAMGRPSFDSIRIAAENTIALYSDDYFQRELAWNEQKVNGFGIQPLLIKAYKRNLISKEEYYENLIKLISINYSIISINGDILFYSARECGFSYSNFKFIKVLDTLEDNQITIHSCINVLSDFLKEIYLESIPYGTRNMYLNLALETLSRKRGILRTLLKFKEVIQNKFHLMPIQKKEVFDYIKVWEKTKLII